MSQLENYLRKRDSWVMDVSGFSFRYHDEVVLSIDKQSVGYAIVIEGQRTIYTWELPMWQHIRVRFLIGRLRSHLLRLRNLKRRKEVQSILGKLE